MTALTRRSLLAGSAAAAALPAAPAIAAAPAAGVQSPGVYRQKIGSFEVTALYDGTWFRKIDDKFVRNAGPAEVNKALTDAFLQPGIVPTSFTALLVNTGSKLVLIDTGTGGQLGPTTGHMPGALAAAGVKPEAIDTIVISHFHPDHINGIKDKDGKQGLPQRRDPRAGAGMGVLDGRRQHERGARGDAAAVPQRAPHLPRHRRRGETLRAGRGGRARHRARSPPTATRRATPPSRSTPATSRCWC